MNRIEFIPLIEPPTFKDGDSAIIPIGTPLTNTIEWDEYRKRELAKNYSNFPEPILKGIYQYRLFDINLEDLEKIIHLHIGDTDINDSISLFGGYALAIDGKIILFPQCCGLLEEIQLWKNILKDNFDDFYLTEGHPSPLITKDKNDVVIFCKDDFEIFFPSTIDEEIRLDYIETEKALIKLLKELSEFSQKLNSLSSNFNVDDLSKIILWGK
jgi:hypothetical protein